MNIFIIVHTKIFFNLTILLSSFLQNQILLKNDSQKFNSLLTQTFSLFLN